MRDQTILKILSLVGVALILAAILFSVFSSDRLITPLATPNPTLPPLPTLNVTPPVSLAELATQYPDLAPILTDPELDSVYKEFLLAYQEGGEEAALELARRRGLLTPEGDVRLTLVLDTEDNAPLAAQLEGAGIQVVSAYRDRVNVAVPLDLIRAQAQADEPGAFFEQLTELEHVIAVRLPEQYIPHDSGIQGEGVAVIGADEWYAAGFTGAGLRIGVLDQGFAGYRALLGVELPDEVTVEYFGWYDDDIDHGTACAEIIHEVAPDAELFFAGYDGSNAALGEAVEWLQAQGVKIISHSAGNLVGRRDGSGWGARLVDDLAAKGILWVNAAGNEARSHYRGVFSDEDGDSIHEFMPGEEAMALYNSEEYILVVLSWEDDWKRPVQDYELFLYDGAGRKLASSENPQSGEANQEPVEGIIYEADGETIYAVVTAYDVSEAATLDIFVKGAEVAHASPGHTICPPGDAIGSLTVGAVEWRTDVLADYSSQGPTADGRLKPEISAPTGVSGATYGLQGFDGTSASAPHVAGAAALVWQAHPEFTRQEVVDFLLANAVDRGPAGPDTGYGYGRLQLPAPPTGESGPTSTSPPATAPVPAATDTPAVLPSPTPVAYVTPEVPPVPPSGIGGGLSLLTGLGLVVGGVGCTGIGLLLVGGIGLGIMRRRTQRVQVPPSAFAPPYPPPSPFPPTYPAPPPPPSEQPQPTHCRFCNAALRPGARFCSACGRRLAPEHRPRYCRHCGARLREGVRFCSRCGKPIRLTVSENYYF